jgi:DNA-binding IclR family transcriptional regulator
MQDSTVKTVDRLVQILDCFTRDRSTWSLADLSAHLKVPKSTLHRILVSLEMHHLLRRNEDDKKWRLGYRLFIWGNLAAESTSLRDIARPFMCKLVEQSGETAILTVYQDSRVICIDICETSHPVRLNMVVGAHNPPHAGASSKALTAYLPEDELETLIREYGLPKLCVNTITDPAMLKAELAAIRARGYADSFEETDVGAWGVATPIRRWDGQVLGAIGLAGPTMRYSVPKIREYAELCRLTADQITSLLGAKN